MTITEHVGATTVLTSAACRGSAPVRCIRIIEIVEIIEHEVHVLLLVVLQMMNNALVLVNFDANMRISLTRDGARLDETSVRTGLSFMHLLCVVHVVAALSGRHVAHNAVAAVV